LTPEPNFRQRCLAALATHELFLALVVMLVTVIVALGFGYENNKLVLPNPARTAHYLLEPHNRLSFMANYDGPDYLSIAKNGYQYAVQTNFFPVYPLLVRLVTVVIRSPLDSSLFISWTSLVGGSYYYLKIFKQLYDHDDNFEALRGLLFFVLFPTGIFLLATYTEGLFTFVSLAAVYYALQKKWLPAALFAAVATGTHITGVFVLLFVAMLLLEQKERWYKISAGFVVGALGLLAYMLFLVVKFHNPVEFISSQRTHGFLHYGHAHLVTELISRKGVFLLLVLAAAVYWWKTRRAFALYSLLYAAIVLLGGLGGFGRYSLADFPIQIMLYDYFRDKKIGYPVVLAFSSIFWTYFLLLYVAGYTGG
jgi:Gpi18-like mannosyltransferase